MLVASAAQKNHERATIAKGCQHSLARQKIYLHSEKALAKSTLCSQADDVKLIRKITDG
jgi:hypothetical protein